MSCCSTSLCLPLCVKLSLLCCLASALTDNSKAPEGGRKMKQSGDHGRRLQLCVDSHKGKRGNKNALLRFDQSELFTAEVSCKYLWIKTNCGCNEACHLK
ncbi:hypothetical protein CRENBAI_026282 [Crenichthys baileyi]|uniref:Secreted protein n=1 Tax=Crenichthys baileyi TaxID=28760 RepID=A0AAV9RPH2_9TELE